MPARVSEPRGADRRPGRSSYRLVGEIGGRHRSFLLSHGETCLGSSTDSDLVIPAAGVSRRHLLLRVEPTSGNSEPGAETGVEIVDRGSKNGTFVDGRRIETATLKPGQTLTVGPVELTLERVAAGDAILAIAAPRTPLPSATGATAPSRTGGSTVLFPSLAPPVLRRWLAALDRAIDSLDHEAGQPADRSPALAAVLRELGAEGACLVRREGDRLHVLAAAGAVARLGLTDRLRSALLEARRQSLGAGAAEESFGLEEAGANLEETAAGESAPLTWWSEGPCEEAGPGGRALAVAGDFPGRAASQPLLRMLARILGPPSPADPSRRRGRSSGSAPPPLRFPDGYVVGEAPAMRHLYARLHRVAGGADPVLIAGETGAGKEPLARILHDSSPLRDGPCVTINCAAIPAELLEAELFGVAAGTATGVSARRGHFAAARGGTLVLDEIGELPLALQAKLLRAIDNREIPRLGGGIEKAEVRVVALTNRELAAEVEAGRFRADLYFRIATHELRVPPLRQRPEDVPALVERFLARAADEPGPTPAGVTAAALDRLLAYSWPGNVRELANEVRRLIAACCDGEPIDSQMLSPAIRCAPERDCTAAGAAGTLAERIEALERRAIEEALEATGGNRTQAADRLGLHRNSLAAKLDRLGIDPDQD